MRRRKFVTGGALLWVGSHIASRALSSEIVECPERTIFDGTRDGSEDVTALLQQAILRATASRCALVLPKGVYAVERLYLPDSACLEFVDAKLLARGHNSVIEITGDNVTLKNPAIDLNDSATCGIIAKRCRDLKIQGMIRVENARKNEDHINGAVILVRCKNVKVGDIVGRNLRQKEKGLLGAYRGLDLSLCSDVEIESVYIEQGDICAIIYGSNGVYVKKMFANEITDNGLYIAGATRNVVVDEAIFRSCGEGVVFYSKERDANVQIKFVKVEEATSKGITLRSGSGYTVAAAMLKNAQFAQSSAFSPSVKGLKVNKMKIEFDKEDSLMPVVLIKNSEISIDELELEVKSPKKNTGIQLVDCSEISIDTLRIKGTGKLPLGRGISIVGARGKAQLKIGSILSSNVLKVM